MMWTFSTDLFSGSGTGWLLVPILQDVLPFLAQDEIQLAHAGLRKLAHVTEYAILALLLVRALSDAERPGRVAVYAVLLSAGWALLDEFHQSFVPSRTAAFSDVVLDTAGAAAGLLLLFLWRRWRVSLSSDRRSPV